MKTIKIKGIEHEVSDEVFDCMVILRDEREVNYNTAVELQREVDALKTTLTDLYDKIKAWRMKTEVYKLHKTESTGKAMNNAKNAVIYAVPGLTVKQVGLMLEEYGK